MYPHHYVNCVTDHRGFHTCISPPLHKLCQWSQGFHTHISAPLHILCQWSQRVGTSIYHHHYLNCVSDHSWPSQPYTSAATSTVLVNTGGCNTLILSQLCSQWVWHPTLLVVCLWHNYHHLHHTAIVTQSVPVVTVGDASNVFSIRLSLHCKLCQLSQN